MRRLLDAIRRTLRRRPRPAAPAITVTELVARLEEIAATTVPGDGLADFNRMYLSVTRAVRQRTVDGGFRDRRFMEHLTGTFGGLYLDAVRTADEGTSRAWAPLFETQRAGRLSIQYALAGMNAHINYDLPIAVVRTCRALGTRPTPAVAADYRAITDLLAEQQEAVRRSFLDGLALETDRRLTGPVADLVGSWSIARARDAAWTHALVLHELDGVDPLEREFLATLGRSVGMAGRMLLAPLDDRRALPTG